MEALQQGDHERLVDALLTSHSSFAQYRTSAQFQASMETMARVIPVIVHTLLEDSKRQDALMRQMHDALLRDVSPTRFVSDDSSLLGMTAEKDWP